MVAPPGLQASNCTADGRASECHSTAVQQQWQLQYPELPLGTAAKFELTEQLFIGPVGTTNESSSSNRAVKSFICGRPIRRLLFLGLKCSFETRL